MILLSFCTAMVSLPANGAFCAPASHLCSGRKNDKSKNAVSGTRPLLKVSPKPTTDSVMHLINERSRSYGSPYLKQMLSSSLSVKFVYVVMYVNGALNDICR